jgi:hypothetical protein
MLKSYSKGKKKKRRKGLLTEEGKFLVEKCKPD